MSETFDWCQDKTKLAIWNKQVFSVNNKGDKWWYFNGRLHRENGPAVEWLIGGRKSWYLNGKRHRVNGPAIEDKWDKRWYLNGKEYSESDYWKVLKK